MPLTALDLNLLSLAVLQAQEAAPAAGAAPAGAAPAQPGATQPAAQPGGQPPGDPAAGGGGGGGGFGGMLMPLVLCFAVLYFLMIRPQRQKEKARLEMLKQVKKGDQVITTAGIVGKVVRADERELLIQVDKENDVRMRFLRSAIHEVIPEGAPAAAATPAEAPAKESSQ